LLAHWLNTVGLVLGMVGVVLLFIWGPLVSGLLALALFGVAAVGQLQDGAAAYEHGDYAEALRLAVQGDARAQSNLGVMYEHGRGVPQDYARPSRGSARPPTRDMPTRSSTSA
jgi:hypothetical protein